jgi:hypothetical protein
LVYLSTLLFPNSYRILFWNFKWFTFNFLKTDFWVWLYRSIHDLF